MTTQAKHHPAKTTAHQHNALGTPRSQHNEPHARQAALYKTQTTTTQRNRLRGHGPSHGEPNSQHGVYTAADDNGRRNTTRRTKADPGTTKQHRNRGDNYTNNILLASARCSAKQPTPNKPTMRRLRQPSTNKTAAAARTRP